MKGTYCLGDVASPLIWALTMLTALSRNVLSAHFPNLGKCTFTVSAIFTHAGELYLNGRSWDNTSVSRVISSPSEKRTARFSPTTWTSLLGVEGAAVVKSVVRVHETKNQKRNVFGRGKGRHNSSTAKPNLRPTKQEWSKKPQNCVIGWKEWFTRATRPWVTIVLKIRKSPRSIYNRTHLDKIHVVCTNKFNLKNLGGHQVRLPRNTAPWHIFERFCAKV